jgi:hypothetical protein
MYFFLSRLFDYVATRPGIRRRDLWEFRRRSGDAAPVFLIAGLSMERASFCQ